MDKLRLDLTHAARALARRPAYTLTVVGTLALVIGANAAIFAVVNATLLRPVPFAAGDRTVAIYLNPPGTTEVRHRNPLHPIDLVRFRQWSRTMTRFEAFTPREKLMTGEGEPEVVRGAMVTAGLFELMGVAPHLGRHFTAADDQPKTGVAIISHGLWSRRFGRDTGILGRRVLVDGEPHVIVGVMPNDFPPPFLNADLFTPFGITEAFALRPEAGPSTYVATVATLRDAATVQQASDEVDAMIRRLAAEYPRTHNGWSGGAWTAREWLYGEMRVATLVLMAATAVVLLIACANIANLTLAEVLGRRAELAMRLALGASRGDLLRYQAVESAIVSVSGAVLGLLLAYAAVPALVAMNPEAARSLGRVEIDWRVQLFTMSLAIVTALLSGLLPALRALRRDTASALGDGSRRTAGSRSERQVRRVLLAAQSALCLALLVAGGVLLRSLDRAAGVATGFSAEHVLTAQIRLPAAVYGTNERRAQAVQAILERVRAVPGVRAASTTQNLFQPGFAFQTVFDVENKPTADGQPRTSHFRRISPTYFQTLGIREIAGRTFTDADVAETMPVAVISRLLAEQYWRGEDPIGQRIRRGGPQGRWTTVVGVVEDVSDVGLGQMPEATLYVPYAQANNAVAPIALVVRTSGPPLASVAAVRAAIFAVDRELPIHNVGTLESFLADSLAPQRFRTTLLALLAGLGLLLAAVGIYGVTARGVAERTREFGVRLALGSSPRLVVRLLVVQALLVVGIGAVVGAAAGAWLAAMLGRVLTNVVAPDVATAAVAVALLAATAIVAAVVPAARVLRLDPVEALRAE
jgi:putative ABC transport system permease protein